MSSESPRESIVTLIHEAIALEAAGMTWTAKHAAAVTGYSMTFLRNSRCPKQFEEGNGPKNHRVIYLPADVRKWKDSIRKAS